MKRSMLVAAAICALCPVGTASAVGEWRYMGPDQPATGARTDATEAVTTAPDDEQAPSNYMSMSAVSARFGDPQKQAPAVGRPPITRWYYPGYTVYFEHDRVITSVFN